MADNYLERKMEEFRNGKLGMKSVTIPRRGIMQVAYPPRRVIVLDMMDEMGNAIVTAFRTAGCLVERCAGADDVDALLKKWGDVDVLVGTGENVGVAAPQIVAHRVGREAFGVAVCVGEVMDGLKYSGMRVNYVRPNAGADAKCVARVCVFLAEPMASGIDGAVIPVMSIYP